jgi:hypothetical protein
VFRIGHPQTNRAFAGNRQSRFYYLSPSCLSFSPYSSFSLGALFYFPSTSGSGAEHIRFSAEEILESAHTSCAHGFHHIAAAFESFD